MPDMDTALKEIMEIDGCIGVALVDHTSGMALGTLGGGKELDLTVAAAGNTDVVRAKLRAMEMLILSEKIEDILITLDTQYHLIRPIHGSSDEKLFFYLVLNRAQANLAMARRDLRVIEQQFYMAAPGVKPGRPTPNSQDSQAFFPSAAGR
jgi:hypothetical protein